MWKDKFMVIIFINTLVLLAWHKIYVDSTVKHHIAEVIHGIMAQHFFA